MLLTASTAAPEKYPDGYPRLAAFMESSDSFGIYRRFGYCHARLLAIHMSHLTEMEKEWLELDKSDEAGGEATNWRLTNRFHEDGLDTTKRDLQSNLEKELLAYGIVHFPRFGLAASEHQLIWFTLVLRYPPGKVRKYQVNERYSSQRPPQCFQMAFSK
jgi:hypothetical protein